MDYLPHHDDVCQKGNPLQGNMSGNVLFTFTNHGDKLLIKHLNKTFEKSLRILTLPLYVSPLKKLL